MLSQQEEQTQEPSFFYSITYLIEVSSERPVGPKQGKRVWNSHNIKETVFVGKKIVFLRMEIPTQFNSVTKEVTNRNNRLISYIKTFRNKK